MRRLQKSNDRKKPKKKAEPLAEGIVVPLDGRGRSWKSMTDDEIIEYACRVVEEKGLKKRTELYKNTTPFFLFTF